MSASGRKQLQALQNWRSLRAMTHSSSLKQQPKRRRDVKAALESA